LRTGLLLAVIFVSACAIDPREVVIPTATVDKNWSNHAKGMLSYSETEKGPRLSLHVSVNTAKLSEQDKNAVEFQIQAHTEFDSSTEFLLDPNAIVLTVGSDVIHPIKIRRGCTPAKPSVSDTSISIRNSGSSNGGFACFSVYYSKS
jgi:hypothetical protein